MWTYDPKTRLAGSDGGELIPRVRLEEAIDALGAAGLRNRSLVIDVLTALSGLSRQEIEFNVSMALDNRMSRCNGLPPIERGTG
jgi:hypothetical protein